MDSDDLKGNNGNYRNSMRLRFHLYRHFAVEKPVLADNFVYLQSQNYHLLFYIHIHLCLDFCIHTYSQCQDQHKLYKDLLDIFCFDEKLPNFPLMQLNFQSFYPLLFPYTHLLY